MFQSRELWERLDSVGLDGAKSVAEHRSGVQGLDRYGPQRHYKLIAFRVAGTSDVLNRIMHLDARRLYVQVLTRIMSREVVISIVLTRIIRAVSVHY